MVLYDNRRSNNVTLLVWMTQGQDALKLGSTFKMVSMVGKVDNVYIMSDRDIISDRDALTRPQPRTLADIAPVSDLDFATVWKDEQFSTNMGVLANLDLDLVTLKIDHRCLTMKFAPPSKNCRR